VVKRPQKFLPQNFFGTKRPLCVLHLDGVAALHNPRDSDAHQGLSKDLYHSSRTHGTTRPGTTPSTMDADVCIRALYMFNYRSHPVVYLSRVTCISG